MKINATFMNKARPSTAHQLFQSATTVTFFFKKVILLSSHCDNSISLFHNIL